MTSVGETLRTQRKLQGRDVTEIADSLCILPSYVSAIERDNLRDLPGVFFYKSFVKQYAAVVGLDYKPLQSCVDALVALEEPPTAPPADSRSAVVSRMFARLRTWGSRTPQPSEARPLFHL